MLRGLFFIHSSGLLLFYKEFSRGGAETKPTMLGGIVTAMMDFAAAKTGLPVSFIQLESLAVSIVRKEGKVICAVFMDLSDGEEFGSLLANQLLRSFLDSYSIELENKGVSDVDIFKEFNAKIAEVIRMSVVPVLQQLQHTKGIEQAFLVSGDQVFQFEGKIDSLSLLATHNALLAKTSELMAAHHDSPAAITLKGPINTVCVHRIDHASLIVVSAKACDRTRRDVAVSSAATLLRKVLVVASNLKGSQNAQVI